MPTTHSTAAPVAFELGAQDFPGGDSIRIERVMGDRGVWMPGERISVKGTYELASHERGVLLLGVTNSGTEGLTTIEPSQQLILERGAGSFELSMIMPAKGWPHVTFYDPRGWQSLRGRLLRRGRERPA
ncbi:MAG: hypothetical protein ACI8UD_002455 [Planctomycetota bacterium]|jgi:hypothetical protein